MEEHEIAYVAGLYEGEGTLTIQARAHRGADYWPTIRLSISMVDVEPLQRAQLYTGVGKISGPYERRTEINAQPQYTWNVVQYAELLDLLKSMSPYLSPRRLARVEEVVAIWEARATETADDFGVRHRSRTGGEARNDHHHIRQSMSPSTCFVS